ncbi:hypothetical protein ACFXKW_23510 [Streptomyces sp. NPDC059193]|uniref:hypothetical protein n=1 Tax=Streptomyces sp. NPDC059193 TaxID=3346763 RepID=UPI00368E5320
MTVSEDSTATTTATTTAADAHAGRTQPVWALWLLSIFLFSLVVALSAGLMESLAGAGLPTVVRSGGTGFATAVALCLAAVPAVRELRKRR